jgi:hypothetical protein
MIWYCWTNPEFQLESTEQPAGQLTNFPQTNTKLHEFLKISIFHTQHFSLKKIY